MNEIFFTVSTNSSEIVLAIALIIFGILILIMQFITLFKYDWIRLFLIWWNENIWKMHQLPYEGPSELAEKISKWSSLFIIPLAIFFVFIGIGIIVIGVS